MWSARRILKELVDADQRRSILATFWKHADQHARFAVQMQLAKAMNFREETVRKMAPEKKADLLASRMAAPEFEPYLEMALMLHHTREKNAMMAAFLDRWNVPHENGSIENDEYTPPDAEKVRAAVSELGAEYPKHEVRLYLATAGLLMDGAWRESTWPVVDEMA